MKKTLSIILVSILLVSGLFILTGCGNNKELTAAAGTYTGLYTKFVGDPDTSKVETEEFSLELKADGKGTHNRDGYSFDVTWSLEGENFKMSEKFVGDPIEYTGTLKDGKLNIFNGEPSNDLTCEYAYQKQ